MADAGLPLGNILSGLSEHPELLGNAMKLASTLASSGMLDQIMGTMGQSKSSDAPPDRSPSEQTNTPAFDLSALLNGFSGKGELPRQASDGGHGHSDIHSDRDDEPFASSLSRDTSRERGRERGGHCRRVGHSERICLLQALRPFLPDEKRDKIDLLIKLMNLLEAAEGMGLNRLF